MLSSLASLYLVIAIATTILLPGYPSYVGVNVALVAAMLAFLVYGWREKAVFSHPTPLAILAAILLVGAVLPFVYRGPQDLMAPVLILAHADDHSARPAGAPGELGSQPHRLCPDRPGRSLVALVGGAYEHLVLGTYRPGLGNSPIHCATLAVMSGSLAMTGVVPNNAPWCYLFVLGTAFGLDCAVNADSCGPMVGALAMSAVGETRSLPLPSR